MLRQFWTRYSIELVLFLPLVLSAALMFMAFTTGAWYWKEMAGWELFVHGLACVLVTRQYRRKLGGNPQ
jgi:hypothetical protein